MRRANELRIRRVSLAIIASVALTAIGACSRQEIADFSGQDITALASNSISSLVGLDTPDQQNQNIETRTRSPLVVPPTNALQAPGSEDQTTRLLGDQWPDDPDVRAREELAAAALERNRIDNKENNRLLSEVGRSQPMSVADLKQGRPDPNRPRADVEPGPAPLSSAPMSPEDLLRRRLDPNRERRQPVTREVSARSSRERLLEPPGRNNAPVPSAADQQEPEKKGLWQRLQFWKRD